MKCDHCSFKLKRRVSFWINPADAIGGTLVFGVIFLIFIWIVSLVVETTRVSLVPAFITADIGGISWFGFFGEFLDISVSVGVFLYFLMYGGAKFAKYFSYLFEFKFNSYKECTACGSKFSVVELPNDPESN
jgi:hypothetical protein